MSPNTPIFQNLFGIQVRDFVVKNEVGAIVQSNFPVLPRDPERKVVQVPEYESVCKTLVARHKGGPRCNEVIQVAAAHLTPDLENPEPYFELAHGIIVENDIQRGYKAGAKIWAKAIYNSNTILNQVVPAVILQTGEEVSVNVDCVLWRPDLRDSEAVFTLISPVNATNTGVSGHLVVSTSMADQVPKVTCLRLSGTGTSQHAVLDPTERSEFLERGIKALDLSFCNNEKHEHLKPLPLLSPQRGHCESINFRCNLAKTWCPRLVRRCVPAIHWHLRPPKCRIPDPLGRTRRTHSHCVFESKTHFVNPATRTCLLRGRVSQHECCDLSWMKPKTRKPRRRSAALAKSLASEWGNGDKTPVNSWARIEVPPCDAEAKPQEPETPRVEMAEPWTTCSTETIQVFSMSLDATPTFAPHNPCFDVAGEGAASWLPGLQLVAPRLALNHGDEKDLPPRIPFSQQKHPINHDTLAYVIPASESLGGSDLEGSETESEASTPRARQGSAHTIPGTYLSSNELMPMGTQARTQEEIMSGIIAPALDTFLTPLAQPGMTIDPRAISMMPPGFYSTSQSLPMQLNGAACGVSGLVIPHVNGYTSPDEGYSPLSSHAPSSMPAQVLSSTAPIDLGGSIGMMGPPGGWIPGLTYRDGPTHTNPFGHAPTRAGGYVMSR